MGYLTLSDSYINGNYLVTNPLYDLRKRAFRVGEEFKPEFPDSIDLKISNRCSTRCSYCHENSVPTGKLANFDETVEHLDLLPKVPIEIALGGGNILEDSESVILYERFVNWFHSRGNIVNVTVNGKEILKPEANISPLIKADAIGVSLGPWDTIDTFREIQSKLYLNKTVYHIILGLLQPELLDYLLRFTLAERFLFLGYKQFGRAQGTELPKSIKTFEQKIKMKIIQGDQNNKVFGFDNLAIEQINLRSVLSTAEYLSIYMGDEFSCSMYVDAVSGQFSKTSRCPERVSWNETDILSFFKYDKN